MTRIESIYQRVFHELPESRSADSELEEQIKAEVENIDCPEEEKERISEIMFTGSSYGQASGFVSGFRFAMALILESLI